MFTIRFNTVVFRRDFQITIRNNVDGWGEDIPGIYENDEWRFELPEDQYAAGLHFIRFCSRTSQSQQHRHITGSTRRARPFLGTEWQRMLVKSNKTAKHVWLESCDQRRPKRKGN